MEQRVTCEACRLGGRVSGAGIMRSSAAYVMASGEIAQVRDSVREFLTSAQMVHGWAVSARAMDVALLVAGELATNVCEYAPGRCPVDLETDGTTLGIVVCASPARSSRRSRPPTRIGRPGLALVLMVCQSFEVRREPVGKSLRVRIALPDIPDNSPSGQTTW